MGGGCCPQQKVTLRNRCYFSPLPNVVVAMPDTRRIVGPETSQSPYNLCSSFRASSLKLLNEGHRADGRNESQHRPVYMRAGLITQAQGSAYVELNRTKVICAVYGPREVPRREDVQMQGQVTCEFKFAPFSCHVRRQPVQDSQEKDLSTQLLEAIRPAICLDKFPKLQVDVYVTVLENDGSALAAAITCASIAVASAGIDMYDLVIGSSAKILGERIFVDPTNSEENTCMDDDPARVGGQLTIGLLPSLNQVSELTFQGDIGFNVLSQAVQICQDTCHKLYPVVQQTLEKIVKDRHKNI